MSRFVIQHVADLLNIRGPGATGLTAAIPRAAPFLSICGGIGRPNEPFFREVVSYVSKTFKHTFIVPGLPELAAPFPSDIPKNVHILYRKTFDIPGMRVRLVGLPLWPYIPPQFEREFNNYLDCCAELGHPHIVKTIDANNRLSAADHHWLEYQVVKARFERMQLVILSRYSPVMVAVPEMTKYFMASATAERKFLSEPGVPAWLFGITPKAITGTIGLATHICSNPAGIPGWLPEMTVSVLQQKFD